MIAAGGFDGEGTQGDHLRTAMRISSRLAAISSQEQIFEGKARGITIHSILTVAPRFSTMVEPDERIRRLSHLTKRRGMTEPLRINATEAE